MLGFLFIKRVANAYKNLRKGLNHIEYYAFIKYAYLYQVEQLNDYKGFSIYKVSDNNMMYINNFRKALNELNSEDFEKFVDYAYDYHINTLYRHGLRKVELGRQVNRFKDGETSSTSHDNMESFIYALDRLNGDNAATDALYGVNGISWREVLIKSTSDLSLPKEIDVTHFLDDIRVLKSVIRNLLSFCADNDKDITSSNLRLVDEFIKIAVSKQKK